MFKHSQIVVQQSGGYDLELVCLRLPVARGTHTRYKYS